MKDEPIFLALFFVTVILSLWGVPDPQPVQVTAAAEPRSGLCHDPRLAAEAAVIFGQTPVDPGALKDHALRIGLCQMLEQGDISPQQVAEIWLPAAGRPVAERSF